jgi:molybdopterin synthase catalytic subunit
MRFRFTTAAIDPETARRELVDAAAGACASFEGWVRNFNDGHEVKRLEYEAFADLAVKEGERIAAEALARFPIRHALCVHLNGDSGWVNCEHCAAARSPRAAVRAGD